MIPVTKPFLPPKEKYLEYITGIWDRKWLTNHGPLVQELEAKLKELFQSDLLFFCGNGTVVLQMALKALNLTGEIITTPFSYVATTSAILWENCTPVFTDVKESDCNIDPVKIEAAITLRTQAILATHVYGNPCDTDALETIAKKHGLKIIYDAAHAFGTEYKGRQLLTYGDISTCSFHATKVFHTIEGGLIMTNDKALADKISLLRQFGHVGDEHLSLGINGKNSEFHAAMGLCNLPYKEEIKSARKKICDLYTSGLSDKLLVPVAMESTVSNYAYFPVMFPSGEAREKATAALNVQNIFPRRYFYPSLNKLPYISPGAHCPISESLSERVCTLPLYTDLATEDVQRIISIINATI